jgi:hypothetical protein
MPPTAADYAWFNGCPPLKEAYCITLVRGLTPEELLARFNARMTETAIAGLTALGEESWDVWDEYGGDELLVAATTVGDWALAVEINGYLGITESLVKPASDGTQLVSHFRNVNAVDHFYWIEDGDVRVTFEPLFPSQRSGSAPDVLVEAMQQAGFDLSDADDRDYHLHTEASFALAEHLTGIPLTLDLLESATYICGLAPAP